VVCVAAVGSGGVVVVDADVPGAVASVSLEPPRAANQPPPTAKKTRTAATSRNRRAEWRRDASAVDGPSTVASAVICAPRWSASFLSCCSRSLIDLHPEVTA